MNAKQIEVYTYFKKLYPGAVILFHVNNEYISLYGDAKLIAQSLSLTVNESGTLSIMDDDLQSISTISDDYEIKMISYRNDEGKYDFPDIYRLQKEKDEDF